MSEHETVEQVILEKLTQTFKPSFLSVENESHRHNVPAHSETHFKVIMVSNVFDGMRAVARHQKVYALLQEQLDGGVHALALHLFTSEEWQVKQQTGAEFASPNCRGGEA